ncbi:MAG: GAF domain-containing protein, partial [Chloroflexi bacterium]|nr:GAF domain-containing protein [Chloroflexota bacterium]
MTHWAAPSQRADHLAGLYAISQILSSTLDLDELLAALVTETARLLAAAECTVSLLEGNALHVFQSSQAQSPGQLHQPQLPGQLRPPSPQPARGYDLNAYPATWRAIRERQPFFITIGEPAVLAEFGYQSLVLAPIVSGGTAIGILAAFSEAAGYFDEGAAQLLQAVANQAAAAIRNARLYQETQRQAEELDLLYRVSQAISSELSERATVHQIAQQVTRAFGASGCAVSRYDRQRECLVTLLDYEPDAPPAKLALEGTVYFLDDYPLTCRIMAEGRPVVVQRNDPDTDPAERALLDETGVQTVLVAPLVVRGNAIGLLEIYQSAAPRHYSPAELRLAERLSVDIAASLDNARLFDQTQQQAQQMAMLSAIQHAIMSALTPEAILREIVNQIQFFLEVNSCSVFLYNERTNRLDLALTADPDLAGQTISIPVDKGIAGQAMRTRRSILVNDTARSAEHQGVLPGSKLTIRSLLCAPLIFQDRVLGVIQALSGLPEAFSELHLTLLDSVAAAMAVALENARLHAGVLRRVAELDALSGSGWAVAGTGELTEILQAIVAGASRVPGVDWANILLYSAEENRFFQHISSRGNGAPPGDSRSNVRSSGISARILQEKAPLLVNDAADDPRVSPRVVEYMGIRSFIGVPVVIGNLPVGVLYANSY